MLSKLLLENGADPNACERFLLHDAVAANHDSLRKVELLVHFQVNASQENAAGMTLLHVAADGKPPKIDFLQLALKLDVDPNKQDRKGDTALHKVTKNYAERTNRGKRAKRL